MKRRSSGVAAFAALLLTTIACSGSLPDWYYGKKGSGPKITLTEETVPPDTTQPIAGGPTTTPSAGTTVLPTVSTGGGTTPTGGTGTGGKGPGGGTNTGGTTRRVANIWKASEDRIGISSDEIRLCGHAALLLGAAFDTSEADLKVYWDDVNAKGGIYGRRVTIDWIDDRYDGTEAANAVKQCVAQDPFMVLGGIGFDQIPFAREEAERAKVLYLHHMAIQRGLEKATYSWSTQPTVEQTGNAFGEYIAGKYRNKRVSIITRNTEYFKPGRDAGLAVLRKHGVKIQHNFEVQKNQGSYNLEIQQMQDDTDVVWIWENALVAANIIIQANHQGFKPKWIVFPFQTTLDLIKEDSKDPISPSIEGVGTWSAYTRGGYGSAYSQFGYPQEIERFEAAYRKFRGASFKPNDILWQTWTGNKALHQLLLDCGKDCSRNRIAGMLLGGLRTTIAPNCEANFAHAKSLRGRIGLHQFIVLETVDKGSTAHWKTISWCRERLL